MVKKCIGRTIAMIQTTWLFGLMMWGCDRIVGAGCLSNILCHESKQPTTARTVVPAKLAAQVSGAAANPMTP